MGPAGMSTSHDNPIRVDFLSVGVTRLRGRIGLTIAPGKKGSGPLGTRDRDLELDLARLANDEKTALLVCLLEEDEMAQLGIASLLDRAAALGLGTLHVAIADAGVPTDREPIHAAVKRILEVAGRGENVVIHCRGGLGRAGLVAACVLVALGYDAEQAVGLVRESRKGAVETPAQEDWIRAYALSLQTARGVGVTTATSGSSGARSPIPSSRSGRAYGALFGLAVGDALGTTLEFTEPAHTSFAERLTGPHREVTGGGPFRMKAGQVTDDTAMALCLARSLHGCAEWNVRDVAERYVAWKNGGPVDIGNQTANALGRVASAASPIEAGISVWKESGRNAAGNGSLMRTAPIAVFFRDPDARRRATIEDSLVTHADPRCVFACLAFNAAIAAALEQPREIAELIAVARQELTDTEAAVLRSLAGETEAVHAARAALLSDLDAATKPDPDLYGEGPHLIRQQGFVRVAFRLAFWQLVHASSVEDALVDVVNRGGDADTNGAITGALLGSAYGRQAIPERWLARVLSALQTDAPGPLRDDYHPKFFSEFVRQH